VLGFDSLVDAAYRAKAAIRKPARPAAEKPSLAAALVSSGFSAESVSLGDPESVSDPELESAKKSVFVGEVSNQVNKKEHTV
jgi:hypothetical protein